MNRTITLVVVKAAFGASLALGFAAAPHGVAHADTPTVTIEEDSVGPDGKSLWKCAQMGNRVCGEGNPEGMAPGFYGEPGEPLRSEWFGR